MSAWSGSSGKRRSVVFSNEFLKDIEQEGSDYSQFVKNNQLPSAKGIHKVILRAGNGLHPQNGSRIFIEFVAYAEGDPDPFESTEECGRPHSFMLSGEDTNLPCLKLAVDSMDFEEVALFICHPSYAYGLEGDPPRILPDTQVLLIVELLVPDAVDRRYRMPVSRMSIEDRQKYFTFQEILEEALCLNNAGNSKFHASDYEGALSCYENGIKILREYKLSSSYGAETDCEGKLTKKQKSQRDLLLYKMYKNQAESNIRQGNPQKVVEIYRDEVVKEQIPMPDHRLLLRLGKAYVELKKIKKAVTVLTDALKIRPGHPKIMELKAEAEALLINVEGKETEELVAGITGLSIGICRERPPKTPASIFSGSSLLLLTETDTGNVAWGANGGESCQEFGKRLVLKI